MINYSATCSRCDQVFEGRLVAAKENKNIRMNAFLPFAIFAAVAVGLAEGQGYGAAGNDGVGVGSQWQQPAPAQQQISSLPQYEGSSGNTYNTQQQQQRPQYNQQQQQSYQGAPQSNGQQYNQVQNYEEQPPYPGCPAAMLCVPDDWCNATGYSEGHPLQLSPAAKAYRVAVSACTNVETNEVGICCRDPDYKDPWPGQNGDGGHEHHHEPKPQGQQQQQQPQQQYQPPQQQYQQAPQSPPQQQQQQQQYRPQPQQPQSPQQPPQQNTYSARPQAPPQQQQQQQPSYGAQPQRQPQPSYGAQTYQQPQQPQKSPFSPAQGQGYQPQAQQQPSYGAQTYSQPSQQAQKPQQTGYGGAGAGAGAGAGGAGGPSPNPYADPPIMESSTPTAASVLKKKPAPVGFPSLIHGTGIPDGFEPLSRLSETPYQNQKPIYMTTSTFAPVEPPSQNYDPPAIEYENVDPPSTAAPEEDDSVAENCDSVPIPSQNHEPPHQPNTKTYDGQQSQQQPVVISIPNQNYAPPPLFLEENNIKPPNQGYEPPAPLEDTATASNSNGSFPFLDSIGIRGSFPTRSRKRFVEECPMSMKCLRESYCQKINPDEGNIEVFDIRFEAAAPPPRLKCRQADLPVDGVCCFLREDYASLDTYKPYKPDLDPIEEIVAAEDTCGIRRPSSNLSDPVGSTSFGEFPWQALLKVGSHRQCGAAIVSRRAVLTSASCLLGAKLDSVVIRVGEWHPGSDTEAKRHLDIKAARILPHPGHSGGLSFDVALVFTQEIINFDYHIGRICLPQPVSNFNGENCISTGWGLTNSRFGSISSSLIQTPLRLLSKPACEQKLRRSNLEKSFKASQTSLCAIADHKDARNCSADEGGPIICENPSTGQYVLAGTLTKVPSRPTCGPPSVYTNVPQVVQWIQDNLMQNSAQDF